MRLCVLEATFSSFFSSCVVLFLCLQEGGEEEGKKSNLFPFIQLLDSLLKSFHSSTAVASEKGVKFSLLSMLHLEQLLRRSKQTVTNANDYNAAQEEADPAVNANF